jgi:MFS family permease
VNRFAPLLGHRGFRTIWIAAVISGLGDRIAGIALYLLIYDLTGNPVDLGILAATQIVPAILLGPVTGLVCDRASRKGIMVVSDAVSALVVAAIPLATAPWHVYALATLLGCGRQFAGPARLALLPDVVGREQLGAANSLLMLTRNLVLLVGPALGGALVAWKGTDPAFWFDAVTFVTSAAILALWRFAEPAVAGRPLQVAVAEAGAAPAADVGAAPTGHARATAAAVAAAPEHGDGLLARIRRLWDEAAEGLVGVWRHDGLRLAFAFFAVLTFVTAMQQPLVVVFVKEVLAGGDVQLGLIISAAGLGGILGAVAGAATVSRGRPLRTIAILTVLDGLLLLVFAFNRSFGVALGLFACFGALATLAQIALATFLQESAPDDRRGRTFGWLGTIVGPLSLAAVFLGPLAASIAGVVAVLAFCGAAEVAIGTAGFRGRARAAATP